MTPADFRAQQETARLARLALAAHRANCSACLMWLACNGGVIELRAAVKAAPSPSSDEILSAWEAERATGATVAQIAHLAFSALDNKTGGSFTPEIVALMARDEPAIKAAWAAIRVAGGLSAEEPYSRDCLPVFDDAPDLLPARPANHIASTGKMVAGAGEVAALARTFLGAIDAQRSDGEKSMHEWHALVERLRPLAGEDGNFRIDAADPADAAAFRRATGRDGSPADLTLRDAVRDAEDALRAAVEGKGGSNG